MLVGPPMYICTKHMVIFQQFLFQVTYVWFHVPTGGASEIQGAPLHRYI